MMIPDLEEFPPGSGATPDGWPPIAVRGDVSGRCYLADGDTLVAVGWLGGGTKSLGKVPGECIDKLFDAYEKEWIFSDGCMGWHDCELCSSNGRRRPGCEDGPSVEWSGRKLQVVGHGHYLIRCEQRVYMAPALLLHYILEHRYRPPSEFVNAVVEGQFLTASDMIFKPIVIATGDR